MSGTFILLVGLVIGSLIYGVSYAFGIGPIPFFGGAILAGVSLIGLIARFAARL